MRKKKVIISWSSGKDSAWMTRELLRDSTWEVVGLFTTLNADAQRVAMHGVRAELLRQQANSIGLPLTEIGLPFPCDNATYEARVGTFLDQQAKRGVECVAFGDLFLEDIRRYREQQLQDTGLTPIFPIWKVPTQSLAQELIDSGFRSVITCIDPKKLPREFAGREFDASLIQDLPQGIDPCGENGEFHTFVYDGPIFETAVEFRRGATHERDGFVFVDLR